MSTIVDVRINETLSIHSQPPKSLPDLSGCATYQGDFADFAPVEIIGKCILISRVYYNSLILGKVLVQRIFNLCNNFCFNFRV